MADYKANRVGEVKDLGIIYQLDAPLDKQIEAFSKVGIEAPYLVTPEETCMIRLSGVSNNGTRTCMAPVGVKGENPILCRISPLIGMDIIMAKFAVNSHANNKYPLFNREIYEVVKNIANQDSGKEPEDRKAHILSSIEDYELTSGMEDTKFVLGKPTLDYFRKFGHSKIKLWNLPTDDLPKDKCIVNYLWFGGPDDGSVFDCGVRSLYDGSMAFGVLRKSGGATSQNFGYSLTNIRQAITTATPKTLENLGLSGIKDTVLNSLEKNVLETLRNQ